MNTHPLVHQTAYTFLTNTIYEHLLNLKLRKIQASNPHIHREKEIGQLRIIWKQICFLISRPVVMKYYNLVSCGYSLFIIIKSVYELMKWIKHPSSSFGQLIVCYKPTVSETIVCPIYLEGHYTIDKIPKKWNACK